MDAEFPNLAEMTGERDWGERVVDAKYEESSRRKSLNSIDEE